MTRPDVLSLDDPRALRALAHEVRQHVITLLYGGAELTATEAAAQCGVTPSAMSYHLRALARWGVVEPADPRPDGRDRPWRAAARTLDLQDAANRSPDATAPLLHSFLGEAQRALRAFLEQPRDSRPSGVFQRGVTRLTVEQADAMSAEILEVFRRYDDLADATDPQARSWDVFYISLPGAAPAAEPTRQTPTLASER